MTPRAGEFVTDAEDRAAHGDRPRFITNYVPRFIIDACELSEGERAEFDYLDWAAIDRGEDSATFVRYKGILYDLGEFMSCNDGIGGKVGYWHGIAHDTFFSATLVHICDDGESVVMGGVYS